MGAVSELIYISRKISDMQSCTCLICIWALFIKAESFLHMLNLQRAISHLYTEKFLHKNFPSQLHLKAQKILRKKEERKFVPFHCQTLRNFKFLH